MNIVFDLDGTLLDSSERLYQLFNYLIPDSKFSKDEYWNMKRDKINHQRIIEKYFPSYDFEEFNKKWLNLIETDKYLELDDNYSDTIVVLEKLVQNNALILLTARQSKENLMKELERLRIIDFFSVILTTEAKKSKEELLLEAITTNLISRKENDFFVSDMGKDIITGNAFGYRTIAITHGFMNRDKLEEYKPGFIIDNLTDVISITKTTEKNEKYGDIQ